MFFVSMFSFADTKSGNSKPIKNVWRISETWGDLAS